MAINLGINEIKELNLGNSKIRKAYLGNTKIYDINQVPANYTKVNFVKQDVSQLEILDLDIPFGWDWSYEIDFRQVSVSNTGFNIYESLCGPKTSSGTMLYYRPNQDNKWCISYIQIYNDSSTSNVMRVGTADTNRHVIKAKKTIYNSNNIIEGYIDGISIGRSAPLYDGIGAASFCLYGVQTTTNRMQDQVEVYNLKLYDGDGILKCNLVPVKRNSDNAPGFYDLVRRRFFTAQFLIAGDVLPYDEEIEYLESTGTQYIDTGLTVKPNLRIVFSVIYREEITDFTKVWGFNASSYEVIWGYENRFYFGGGYSEYSKPVMDTEYSMDYDFTPGNMVAKVNNTIVRQTTGTQPDIGIPIYIFACRDNNLPYIRSYAAKHKAFKIYNNGILVRDLIPVRVGQVGYMYDKVSNQLFGNSGTGDFILDPDI